MWENAVDVAYLKISIQISNNGKIVQYNCTRTFETRANLCRKKILFLY